VAIGFLIGFRVDNGLAAALAAFGLCLLYGFCFCWLFNTLGLIAGSPQAAQSLSLFVFPVVFVSSAYVPVTTMPGWMQWFAQNQPITPMVNSVRILTEGRAAALALGHPLGHYLPVSLFWCAVLVVVFAPLSVARYRRS
jgi:ABC-2 type transport system permease protein